MGNFNFTDLVSLVGTNPLPNYIVAKWFLDKKNNGNCSVEKFWLVYTKQTKKYAENLEKEFKKIGQVSIEKRILSDESSVFQIRKDFSDILDSLRDKSVHLNYTGGPRNLKRRKNKT